MGMMPRCLEPLPTQATGTHTMNPFQKRLFWLLTLMAVLIGGNAYLVSQSADGSAFPWYRLTQNLTHLNAS